MPLLHPGDTFPKLTLNIPGAQPIPVPGVFGGEFGVLLFNRGAWCPYCTAQLRAFQRASESLTQAGIRVAALWVDNEKTTAEFIAKHGLTFPLGHSADARAVAALTGAFVHDNSLYLQSTGFVLDPQGTGRSVGLSGGGWGASGRFLSHGWRSASMSPAGRCGWPVPGPYRDVRCGGTVRVVAREGAPGLAGRT